MIVYHGSTALLLKAYFGGFYGNVGSDRAIRTALEMVEAIYEMFLEEVEHELQANN